MFAIDRATAVYILRTHYGLTVKPRESRTVIAAMLVQANNAAGRGWNQPITVTPNR